MPRPSKIHGSGFESEIVYLYDLGYSNNRIAEELKAKGFNVSGRAVGRFLTAKGYQSRGQVITYDKTCQSGVSKTKEEQVINPMTVDVQKVLNDLDINQDFSNIDNVVDANQKLAMQIFLYMGAILFKKLEQHSDGLCKYPSEQARGFRIGVEVMQSAYGYSNTVNLAQAMKTLESQGYQIQGFKSPEKTNQST